MAKIGVFGGTFDPVHFGHIYLARRAVSECGLNRAIVVPAEIQPFKSGITHASGEHRYNMVKLAFENDENIIVSDIELKKGGTSYTIDTLKEIRSSYAIGTEIYFILGVDAFLKIEIWKEPAELLSDFSFIIGARPGYGLSITFDAKYTVIENKQIAVSSSEIRQIIKSGGDISGFVPPAVERYISANGLYKEVH